MLASGCCFKSPQFVLISSLYSLQAISYYNQSYFSCMLVHGRHSVDCCDPAGGPLWWGAGWCGGVGVLPWVWTLMGCVAEQKLQYCLWSHVVTKSS